MIVGEAKVVIRAIGGKLESDISKALERAGAKAGKSGEKTGENYADGVSKGIDSNSDKIRNSIASPIEEAAKSASEKAGRSASKNIEGSLNKGGRKLQSSGEVIGKRVGESVSKGFQRSRITRTIGSALVKLGVFIPVIGALIGGISALVSGLFAIGAVATTAAGSVVVLGNALTAGLQGIAVFAIAAKGVGKAIGEGFKPDNAEKFAEALKKVAPAARPFVKEFVGLKDEFVAIRDSAAKGLFPGLETALGRISPLLPKMRKGFEEAGRAAGKATDNFFKSVTTKPVQNNFATLTASNNKVLKQFGNILGDLAATLIALFTAAAPLTERFVSYLEKGADKLREMTEAGTKSGNLQAYFEEVGSAAALLGSIFGNIFEGLRDIGRAAYPTGKSLLQSFDRVTEKMANFTDDLGNVSKLETFFQNVAVNVRAIGDLSLAVGAAFARMGADPGVAKTAKALEKIVPVLEDVLTKAVASIGPAIAELLGELLKLFSALEESGAIRVVIEIFTGVAKAITTLLGIPILGSGILKILAFVAAFKALKLVAKGGAFMGGQFALAGAGIGKFLGNASAFGSLARTEGLRGAIDATFSGTGRLGMFRAQLKQTGETVSKTATVLGKSKAGFAGFGKSVGALVPPGAGRNIAKVGVAGLAIGTVGVAAKAAGVNVDKFSNTLSGAALGFAVGGGPGAAIGAAAGAVLDLGSAFFSARKKAKEASEEFKKSLKAITNSTSDVLKTSTISDDTSLAKTIADKYKKTFETRLKNLRANVNFDTSKSDKELDNYSKNYDRLVAKINKGTDDFGITLDFNQADADLTNFLKDFKADVKASGKDFKFDISGTKEVNQQSRELLGNLVAVGQVTNTIGGTENFQRFRDQLISIKGTLGITKTEAVLVANALSGVPDVLEGIPDQKNFKFTADVEKALQDLNVPQDKIDEIRAAAEKGVHLDISANGADANGAIETIKAKLQGLKDTDVIRIRTDAGDVEVKVGDIRSKLDSLTQENLLTLSTTASFGATQSRLIDVDAALLSLVSGNNVIDVSAPNVPKTANDFYLLDAAKESIDTSPINQVFGTTGLPAVTTGIQTATAQARGLGAQPANVNVTGSLLPSFGATIGGAQDKKDALGKPVSIPVSAKPATGLFSTLADIAKTFAPIEKEIVTNVKVNTSGGEKIGVLRTQISTLKSKELSVKMNVTGTSSLIVAKNSLKGFKGTVVRVSVRVSGTGTVNGLKKSVASLKGSQVKITVSGATKGTSEVKSLSRAIAALKGKSVKVSANTSGQAALSQLKRTMDSIKSKSTTITVTTVKKSVNAATGGLITGPGSGTSDSIPAMLSNGEYVINARQTAKYKDLLQRINTGQPVPTALPDLSNGAPVENGRMSTTSSGTSQSRIISGELVMRGGRAYIQGIAQDVNDSNQKYNRTVKGMKS